MQKLKTNRVNEMMATMKSFSKDKYQKNEMLAEMFALQQEIVGLTFNGEHASTADLKLWDVERHLEQLNQDCGNVADEELQRFKEGSKTLCNLIKAEISGNRGEAQGSSCACGKSEVRMLRPQSASQCFRSSLLLVPRAEHLSYGRVCEADRGTSG